MADRLSGKIAIVTGGAHGIGRAYCDCFAGEGAAVAAVDLDLEHAQRVADGIAGAGGRAIAVRADVSDEASTLAMAQTVIDAFGGIDVLVNNASIFERDTIETATRESWDHHIGTNLRVPFVLTQALAAQAPEPSTDAQGAPVAEAMVVNMIDQRVRKLTPEFMTYTIAKMALWAFTRTAAQALAPRVRVNAIGPGPTVKGHRQSDDHFARQRAATLLGRGSDASDITAALLYFLNAPAVTGQLLCVDGGQHLAWETPDVLGVE